MRAPGDQSEYDGIRYVGIIGMGAVNSENVLKKIQEAWDKGELKWERRVMRVNMMVSDI